MLHIGVVFVVFGVFLLGAGLIPDDVSAQNAWSIFAKDSWWNELVLTGLFAMGLGIFLIVLNGIISKKEDEDLEAYVQSQLTRSRSGRPATAIRLTVVTNLYTFSLHLQAIVWNVMSKQEAFKRATQNAKIKSDVESRSADWTAFHNPIYL